MNRDQIWLSEPSNKKIAQLRQLLAKTMEEQSRNIINYYDFLLVAKKLNFRFQQSNHLMALRKYFFRNKNQLPIRKLVGLLAVNQESLSEAIFHNGLPDKIIVKFNVDGDIEPIKQLTNQDQELMESRLQTTSKLAHQLNQQSLKQQPSSVLAQHKETEEFKQKMTIILSIKVSEMIKKIRILVQGVESQDQTTILNVFDHLLLKQITYELFKKGIVSLLRKIDIEHKHASSFNLSQDDIKALFFILDHQKRGFINKEQLLQLTDYESITQKITEFYQQRINKKMVQNTMFKLGKINSSIQIFQLKNASVIEFKTMEDAVLNQVTSHQPNTRDKIQKSRNPHFGPIKGNNLRSSPSKNSFQHDFNIRTNRNANRSALSTYKVEDLNDGTLSKQRQKIDRIIRTSKQQKKRKGRDTIANKLRKLFIHKVILPRQRMLEEQKNKYSQPRSQSNNLTFRPM